TNPHNNTYILIYISHTLSSFLLTPRYCHITLFFFTAPATTEIYTLSLHDALPISLGGLGENRRRRFLAGFASPHFPTHEREIVRSEEHTSELQSRGHLVCRLLLEKKKKNKNNNINKTK